MFDINLTITLLNDLSKNSMVDHLGIEFTEIGDNFLVAKMPVDHRTVQPMRLLHGGASVTLAETMGSIGAHLVIDQTKQYCVGLEINANHIRSVTSGFVYGKSTPIHIGRSTQIWQTEIKDESGNLVCISRLTVAVMNKR